MKMISFVAAISAAAIAASPASAASGNLVTNGDFETAAKASGSNNGSSNNFQITTAGTYGTVNGWQSTGATGGNGSYNLLFNTSNAASASGTAYSYYSNTNTAGSTYNQQYLRALPATSGGIGAVGNFAALDGDTGFSGRSLNTTVNGLVTGQSYTLQFDWAAGSLMSGDIGATTAGAAVVLGSQTLTTVLSPNVPSNGWTRSTTNFIYNGSGNLLSFIASGTPNGAPPMFLLDNVSVTSAVPEPASWVMMLVGFGMVGAVARRRRAATKVTYA